MTNLLALLAAQYARFRWRSAALLLLTAVTVAYQATFSYSFKLLVDDILVPGKYEMLALFLILLAAGAVLSFAAELAADVLLVRMGVKAQDELRYRLFRHMQMLPESYYRKQSPSSVVSRLGGDLNTVHAAFLTLHAAVGALLGLLFSMILLGTMSKWLFLGLLVGLPVCFIWPRNMNKPATAASDLYKTRENFGELILDRVTFHQTIRAYGLHRWEFQRLSAMTDDVAALGVRAQLLRMWMGKSVSVALLLLNVAIIAAGAYMSRGDALTIGILVSFQSFFVRISGYASSLTRYFPQFVQGGLSWERLNQGVLNERHDPEETEETAGPPIEFREKLELSGVSFGYTDAVRSLSDVSMTIPRGAYCAIVGSSGSGKTSIVSLLMRFYEPLAGSIALDETDVRRLPLDGYRRLMSYVPQEVVLFGCSIRENIRVGRLDATDAEIEAAAKEAGIHDWIVSQPGGYEGTAGDKGRFLSGGQKQRLALARAFVRKPSILILDEATSSLDPGNESELNDTLRRYRDRSTVVSVTHRLQTVRHADRIFVVDGGELAGWGTHEALLASCGAYQKLWFKQSGFTVSEDGSEADITFERLQQIPIFRTIDERILEDIHQAMTAEKLDAGVTVMKQGEEGSLFYIIVRGQVEVVQESAQSGERKLAVLEDGDYFGEMALLRQIPRTATIRTLTPSVFLTMHRDLFQKAIAGSPELRRRLEARFEERIAMHQ